jgi:predicted dehydrogenase
VAGAVFHAPLIEAVDGLELSAVLTRSPERATSARQAHSGVRVVEDVGALLEDIDVLVVATPNRTHAEIAAAGLERGLAVVVDKPLATTVEDGRRLVDAPGHLTVFHNRRWDGDFLTLRRLVAEGALGDVFRLESRVERFRPEVKSATWRESADAAEGGGLLLDLGPHLVDQALQLFGPPVSVYGELHRRRPGAQVEDDVFVALEHAGGERSHLWMSAVAPLFTTRFRVNGTRAGFATEGLDPQEAQLADGMRPGDEHYGVAPDANLERGAYERFYEGVVAWLRDGVPPPVDPRDSVAVLHLLDAARSSAASHSVIELEDSP